MSKKRNPLAGVREALAADSEEQATGRSGAEIRSAVDDANSPLTQANAVRQTPMSSLSVSRHAFGGLAEMATRDLLERAEERIADLVARGVIEELDPSRLQKSPYNPRSARSLQASALSDLLKQIRDAGRNVQPILVRPIVRTGADGVQRTEHEIVYGHRRTVCCEMLRLKVRAVVMELSDDEAALYQEQENEGAEKPSLFEYGSTYLRMIGDGIYEGTRQLSDRRRIPLASVALRILVARVGAPFDELGCDARRLGQRDAEALRDWFEGLGIGIADPKNLGAMKTKAEELMAAAEITPGASENPFKVLAAVAKRWRKPPRTTSNRVTVPVHGLGGVEVLKKPKETVVTIPAALDIDRLEAWIRQLAVE